MRCSHPRLTFGSSGYYLVCTACDAWWKGVGPQGQGEASVKAFDASLTGTTRDPVWDEEPVTSQETPGAKGEPGV